MFSLLYYLCQILSAMFCLPCSVCLVLSAMFSLSYSLCHVLSVIFSLPCSLCQILSAMFCLPCSLCHILSAMFCLPCSVCPVLSVLLCTTFVKFNVVDSLTCAVMCFLFPPNVLMLYTQFCVLSVQFLCSAQFVSYHSSFCVYYSTRTLGPVTMLCALAQYSGANWGAGGHRPPKIPQKIFLIGFIDSMYNICTCISSFNTV